MSLSRRIQQAMDSANVPGASVAIIQKGRLTHCEGYGLTKNDSSQRVTAATVFDAASLSKPVFAYAVLQLVQENKFDLDKPLYQYLPYPDIESDERYKQITARMVLSHTTGFPNWRGSRPLSIRWEPGKRFGYSGEGFVYLQKVIETISGQQINEFISQRVFRPLQMTRSGYVWQPQMDTDFAYPHDNFGIADTKRKPTQANTAYSLQTTAEDYARFMLAIMQSKGLSPTTVGRMLSPQSQLPKRFSGDTTLAPDLFWGLGFGLEKTPSGDYFWHWGDNGTFRCFVGANQAQQKAVILFTNSFNGLSLARELIPGLLGGQHPLFSFLGYDSYKTPGNLFANAVLKKGVPTALEPFRNDAGVTTIPEDNMNWVGNQLLRIGRVPEALAVLEHTLKAYPRSATVNASYAYALLRSGDQPRAVEYLKKALDLKPDNERLRQTLSGLTNARSQQGPIRLVLKDYPNARLVTLAGSFNDWNNLHTFFTRKNTAWECSLDLKPGTYTYKIFVDGKWINDPANPNRQRDEQGNENSVLVVQ
ncbi:hypothetical protein GCM10023189_48020 [Nibrella saemangeumensis]|uniref:CubicO group peptidase, beta-lactamase class C family n=2 Tax=Nibrella saemangeumensis TaxID=1084526 RepID=A0ABP8NFU6_9BACT